MYDRVKVQGEVEASDSHAGKEVCMRYLRQHWKRILYMLCFFMLCAIEQRSKNAHPLYGWREFFASLTGIVMLIIIISHYKLSEFLRWKKIYIIWTVVGLIGVIIASCLAFDRVVFFHVWMSVFLTAYIGGYVLIHTFIAFVIEKKRPELNKPGMILWLTMMLGMLFSRSDLNWPIGFLLLFGCFYLTDYTAEEQEDLLQGMLDGLILGFFILQGHAFLFRPYEEARYRAFFSNPNWNSLFYVEILAAVFAKIVYVTKKESKWWIKVYYWLGAGVLLSYEFMTIGRSGWLTAILLSIFFVWAMSRLKRKKEIIRHGAMLILCFAVTFPVCFGAARYLPPFFHHVIWFYGEWSENKVHSWDKWDSPKFIDIDEFFEAVMGRMLSSLKELSQSSPLLLKAEAAEPTKAIDVTDSELREWAKYWGLPPEDPRLRTALFKTREAVPNVRIEIYKYYFQHLNMTGHKQDEQGFQLLPVYIVGHAHNIFLQWGTDFGIPVMLLYILLIIWSFVCLKRKYTQNQSIKAYAELLYVLIPAVFGMFEYAWGVGALSITMQFVAFRGVVVDEKNTTIRVIS